MRTMRCFNFVYFYLKLILPHCRAPGGGGGWAGRAPQPQANTEQKFIAPPLSRTKIVVHSDQEVD